MIAPRAAMIATLLLPLSFRFSAERARRCRGACRRHRLAALSCIHNSNRHTLAHLPSCPTLLLPLPSRVAAERARRRRGARGDGGRRQGLRAAHPPGAGPAAGAAKARFGEQVHVFFRMYGKVQPRACEGMRAAHPPGAGPAAGTAQALCGVYVSVRVCKVSSVYTYIYIYIYMYAYIYIYIYAYFMYIYIYIYIHMHIYIYI